jgi:hypothetical protein
MRALGLNIYMYMRGEYTKKNLQKYIKAKDYYTSNIYYPPPPFHLIL